MNNYLQLLKQTSKKFNSIVCLGLDPVLNYIPLKTGSIFERITNFYSEILNCIIKHNVYPSAVKPNYAFYAQYGIEGIEALVNICSLFKGEGFPVILDVKRGDIGKTASAYSREAYEFFSADAVTLSPFMGYDSIKPFIDNYPDKGSYILNKTSNKSSNEIQDLNISDNPLYIHIAKLILEWHYPGIGAVIGATYPGQLKEITDIYNNSGKEVSLLIPGVGTQGGSVNEIIQILKNSPDITIHRINSSSAINYAYKKYSGLKYPEAAVEALKDLNSEIEKNI